MIVALISMTPQARSGLHPSFNPISHSLEIITKLATNSTCANFFPKQSACPAWGRGAQPRQDRCPSENGRNAPLRGTLIFSFPKLTVVSNSIGDLVAEFRASNLEGLNSLESGPQICGSRCTWTISKITAVPLGMGYLPNRRVSSAATLGTPTTEGNNRNVSNMIQSA